MELRGFEPRTIPAKIVAELHRMFVDVVTRGLSVLRICLGVLRDVASVAVGRPRELSAELSTEFRTRRRRDETTGGPT